MFLRFDDGTSLITVIFAPRSRDKTRAYNNPKMDFAIPLHTEDLEIKKKGVFSVHSVLDPEILEDPCSLLDNVSDKLLNGDIFKAAIDNEVFDPLYSFIK